MSTSGRKSQPGRVPSRESGCLSRVVISCDWFACLLVIVIPPPVPAQLPLDVICLAFVPFGEARQLEGASEHAGLPLAPVHAGARLVRDLDLALAAQRHPGA